MCGGKRTSRNLNLSDQRFQRRRQKCMRVRCFTARRVTTMSTGAIGRGPRRCARMATLVPFIFISGNRPAEQMGFFMSYIRARCVTLGAFLRVGRHERVRACARVRLCKCVGGLTHAGVIRRVVVKRYSAGRRTATEFFLILARAWGSPLCQYALISIMRCSLCSHGANNSFCPLRV